METLFYLVPNVLRIYSIYILVDIFLKKKDISKWIYFVAYSTFYAVNSFLYLRFDTILVNVASNLIPLFLITFLYNSKVLKKVFTTFIIYAVAMFWEIIIYDMINILRLGNTVIICEFVSPIMMFVSALFLQSVMKQRFQIPSAIKAIYYFVLVFIPAGSVVIGCLTISRSSKW